MRSLFERLVRSNFRCGRMCVCRDILTPCLKRCCFDESSKGKGPAI